MPPSLVAKMSKKTTKRRKRMRLWKKRRPMTRRRLMESDSRTRVPRHLPGIVRLFHRCAKNLQLSTNYLRPFCFRVILMAFYYECISQCWLVLGQFFSMVRWRKRSRWTSLDGSRLSFDATSSQEALEDDWAPASYHSSSSSVTPTSRARSKISAAARSRPSCCRILCKRSSH